MDQYAGHFVEMLALRVLPTPVTVNRTQKHTSEICISYSNMFTNMRTHVLTRFLTDTIVGKRGTVFSSTSIRRLLGYSF